MTAITLTQEQMDQVVQAHLGKFADNVKRVQTRADKAAVAAKRRADARVERANQKTTEWLQQYSATRSELLKAQGEIARLKRKLKNGEWE